MAPQRIRDTSIRAEMPGLQELVREMRAAGPLGVKLLQQVNKALAERVAAKARAKFYATTEEVGRQRSGPDRAGRRSGKGSVSRSRESIRAQATAKEVRVVGGGPKAEGFFGHEFGGGARPRTRQFPVHRGVDGYVLYPTLREEVKNAKGEWEGIFEEMFGRRGPI